MTEKKPYHQQVAEEIIEALENGTAPWMKPWEPGEIPGAPVNAATGKQYRGINHLRLFLLQMKMDNDPRWCTYKQAQSLGAQVKKGSKGTSVQYWIFNEKQEVKDETGKPIMDETGKPKTEMVRLDRPKVVVSTVFHSSQIENLPPLRPREPLPEWERHQQAEKLLKESGATILNDQSDRAFYRLSSDEIHLPKREQFPTPDKYYATAFHELGHWTGHESRLNRDMGHPFNSGMYAREELRAEIASYMVGTELDIGHDPGQHYSYIQSWIEELRKDPREIIRASQDAERIKEYVMGRGKEMQTQTSKPRHEEQPTAEQQFQPGSGGERTWLNVSYEEKDQAKAVGAKWDRDVKRWYAPEGTDLEKLKKWIPEEQTSLETSQTLQPVLNPKSEFGRVLQDAGLVVGGDPIMDGKIHRVPVENGKPGSKDGAYCGYENADRPNGWFQNHKTGEQGKWLATGHVVSPEKKKELKEDTSKKLAEAEEARKADQEKSKKRAYAKWVNAKPVEKHEYLEGKGVGGIQPDDVRQNEKNNIIIPAYDIESGEIQTLQHVNKEGRKWFEKGCPRSGALYMFPSSEKPKSQEKEGKEIVLIAEGFATGASLYAATGLPVAVAFNSGNLKDAALAIKKKLPNAAITICADDDHMLKDQRSGKPKNIGVIKAKEAAAAVGGKVIIADFTPEEKKKGLTDFNDLHQSRGLDAVKKQVENGLFQDKEVGR